MKDDRKNKKGNTKPTSAPKAKPRNAGTSTTRKASKPGPRPVQKKSEIPDDYKVPNFKKTNGTSALPSPTKSNVKKRKKKKAFKTPLIVAAFALVFVGAVFALLMSGSNTVSGLGSFFSSLGSGKGYPVAIDNTGIVSTRRIGSGILLLGNDSAQILNSTAKELVRVQHTFLNPESDIANGRAIIYSRASGRVEVINRGGVLYETDLGRNILTATIGKKGNIAIASQSISAQSELIVLDKKGKTIFSWECATERISAVALSNNGKSVAVAVLGAANTELYSRVLVFNVDASEPVIEFNYPENAVIKLKFGSQDTLIVVGDKVFGTISVKDNTKEDIISGSGDVLERFYIDENGKTAMVLSPFGNESLSKLLVYDSTGNLLFETNCNQEVKWVSCDENYVAVLTKDEVQCFNNTGSRLGVFKADKYSERVVLVGKYTYLFEKGLITQYNTVGLSR